jgi:CHAT domain-containing protein/tetratricopeptide (TPR) repeat protein
MIQPMLIPLLLSLLVSPQVDDPLPPSPFDRVVELEMLAGESLRYEYESEFEGTLHVWVSPKLDLSLRVHGERSAAFSQAPGNLPVTYGRLVVQVGSRLAVLVEGIRENASVKAAFQLHLIASPETNATRAAVSTIAKACEATAQSQAEGDPDSTFLFLKASAAEFREIPGGEYSDVFNDALWRFGYTARDVGCSEIYFDSCAQAYRGFERCRPAEHPERVAARFALGIARRQIGDLAGARAMLESVLEIRERNLPHDDPDLLKARTNAAVLRLDTGDLRGARALQESVLASYERSVDPGSPDLLRARSHLANTLRVMGDISGARALEELVLDEYERTRAPDDFELLRARGNLATSMRSLGDLTGARAHEEAVLSAYARLLPADHSHVLSAQRNLAATMWMMGEAEGAHILFESVLESYERTLPTNHPNLTDARANLALSLGQMGDLASARALEEAVLRAREDSLPADHPGLLLARTNLAVTMRKMGDLEGARLHFELVLEAGERIFPPDSPDLLRARMNLSVAIKEMGDWTRARQLEEQLLEAYERTVAADSPALLVARSNLAITLKSLGEADAALALEAQVIEARERTLPAGHPDLLHARSNLASTLRHVGDATGARLIQERVLEAHMRTLPADHPTLHFALMELAVTRSQQDDQEGLDALMPSLIHGMQSRVLASLSLSPRQARQLAATEALSLAQVFYLTQFAGAEIEHAVFELTETLRLVATEAPRSLARFGSDTQLEPILEEASEVRRALGDLIAQADAPPSYSDELTRLSIECDRLERKANQVLASRGVVAKAVETVTLAKALKRHTAAVGYRRIRYDAVDETTGESRLVQGRLLAHVLRADGTLTRVNLGPADELEELVRAWRGSLGGALNDGLSRGISIEGTTDVSERSFGVQLRKRVLDPILEAAGEGVERLHVCADDLIFAIPLDALPLGEEGRQRLGDQVEIINEVSFARLLAPETRSFGVPSLLAVGGVDYDAEGASRDDYIATAAPVQESASRGGSAVRFNYLPETGPEAEAAARLFERVFGYEAELLANEEVTKRALSNTMADKRYIHLATHGWFAPASVKSTEDERIGTTGLSRMSVEERVTGFAPMTLCGLALVGANHGADSLGRVKGILTAEELCTLDLSRCELAVLSACETNVGIRRAGQGIQSLQSALYAGGACTSITSLWKVDDAATRRLMELFYTNLWIGKMPKSDALWSAKCTLRDEGFPPSAWAAWVMTGDPQ